MSTAAPRPYCCNYCNYYNYDDDYYYYYYDYDYDYYYYYYYYYYSTRILGTSSGV